MAGAFRRFVAPTKRRTISHSEDVVTYCLHLLHQQRCLETHCRTITQQAQQEFTTKPPATAFSGKSPKSSATLKASVEDSKYKKSQLKLVKAKVAREESELSRTLREEKKELEAEIEGIGTPDSDNDKYCKVLKKRLAKVVKQLGQLLDNSSDESE